MQTSPSGVKNGTERQRSYEMVAEAVAVPLQLDLLPPEMDRTNGAVTSTSTASDVTPPVQGGTAQH